VIAMTTGLARYFRLLGSFARFSLANELAFRGNFLMKVLVELLWLFILLIFYDTIFRKTNTVAGWDSREYLFFVGCYYAMEGLIETLFLENCSEFADLVRSGNLDLYLLRPIDEQFLITCRKFDWSTAPKVGLGAVVMGYALAGMTEPVGAGQVLAFVILFVCGTALAYSFLLLLTSTSVWLVRNQSLMEMWWLLTTVMRYPRQIYKGPWAEPLGVLFWYVLPVLLVINVPVSVVVRRFFDPWGIALLAAATAAMLYLSRRYFLYALRSYRSASS
jgi:ABC-2 type transport system permease protein